MRRPVYQRLNYERNYSQKKGKQTDAEGKIDKAWIARRINASLFCA